MAWATADEVLTALEDAEKVDPGQLPEEWTRHAERGVASAKADIRGALYLRGYSFGQVENLWGDLHAIHLDLSVLYGLTYGGVLNNYDTRLLDKLDHRPELPNMRLADVTGTMLIPANLVGHGRMKNTPDTAKEPVFTDPNQQGAFRPW